MSPRWFLVPVLASPMLLPLTSGVAARSVAQGPKAVRLEGGPARAGMLCVQRGDLWQ